MNDDFTNMYIEGYRDFPLCNHVKEIGPENIGYTSGMMIDGLPFEVEIYSYGMGVQQQKELAIIMPDIYVEEDDCEDIEGEFDENELEKKVTGFSYQMELKDYSALPIGMVERGQEDNFKIIQWYLEYLEEMGIVNFVGDLRSCSVFYFTDANGNDLVQVRTSLITNGMVEAETDIVFREFPYREQKRNCLFKVVKKES